MNSQPLPLYDNPRGNAAGLWRGSRDDGAMAVWLRRSLSCKYDAVLAEDLPAGMIALAEDASVGH